LRDSRIAGSHILMNIVPPQKGVGNKEKKVRCDVCSVVV